MQERYLFLSTIHTIWHYMYSASIFVRKCLFVTGRTMDDCITTGLLTQRNTVNNWLFLCAQHHRQYSVHKDSFTYPQLE